MRWIIAFAGAALIAGCAPAKTAEQQQAADAPAAARDALAPPAAGFDYRYAFRMPGDRIGAVQESHAKGCERLGPARCRITAMRYRVDDRNRAQGVLTLTIDPAIARGYGMAAIDTVARAKGALVDSQVVGDDAAGSIATRLDRAATETAARAAATTDPAERTALNAEAARARAALATIAALDRSAGPLLATVPVLVTYSSGSGIAGGANASFQGAGDTFLTSLAGLANLLAGIGPWIVLMIVAVVVLRRFIHDDQEPREAPRAPARFDEPRNAVQRWFGRDPAPAAREDEPVR